MARNKPTLLITTGDPLGIGPEVTEKALEDPGIKALADICVIKSEDATGFEAIKRAVRILKKGGAKGIITAPVNKSKINKAGTSFKGHTEYLAGMTHTKRFAMMFSCPSLKVGLVTRHIALKDVPRMLRQDKIRSTVLLVYEALRRHFRIRRPRIGVSGLNPHCGEGGLTGKEEGTVIVPAIKSLKQEIAGIEGPLPADVVFYMTCHGKFDAAVSMYHDQALGPFKMIAFDSGVNVTLGLPFVRTSPDHGTAYDIAGKGIASPNSMKEAIRLAVRMCKR